MSSIITADHIEHARVYGGATIDRYGDYWTGAINCDCHGWVVAIAKYVGQDLVGDEHVGLWLSPSGELHTDVVIITSIDVARTVGELRREQAIYHLPSGREEKISNCGG